ncbi:MAG: 6-pyruvoyl-tetrahydropterin synthase-related protein [Chloroflexota bacterium]
MSEPTGRRHTWWHLLLTTLLGLPLITPLLRWSSVPCTHDGHLHYHRVAAIRHAWEDGILFSRWLPDLAFGYGYPFFLYREPLPLYLTHFLHLAGLPLPAATNLFYAATILAAGAFTYLWVRDIFGAPAGIVAAVAYMAAPYQLVDALVRGNQVESLALALFPLLLWAGRRFLLGGAARWFLVGCLGLAALALSHNISLLLFTPALGLYLLALVWIHRLPWPRGLGRAALLMGIGLGLTAFYTGPAVLEMDEVTLSLSTTTRNNDFRYNFASLGEIFSAVSHEDPTLINPPLPFRLGWTQTALGLLGLLSLFGIRRREQRAHLLLMAGAAAIFLAFALPLSRPLWEALPLIEFVQFPWRFVGRAALPLAVLAAAPVALIDTLWARRGAEQNRLLLVAATALPIVLLALEAYPLLYPTYCPEAPFPDIADVHRYERETGLVGVDPEGSYFPTTVRSRPQGSPLEADYLAGRPPQRFDESALPQGARLLSATYGPNRARIEIESPAPFRARYLSFAFPGWRAQVDGETVPISAAGEEGLIAFPVPAGRHTVAIEWSLTPLRAAFGAASALSLLLLVAAVIYLRRRPGAPLPVIEPPRGVGAHRALALTLLALALVLLGAKIVVDRVETPLRRASGPALSAGGGLQAGELQLAGFTLSRERVPSGETVDVHLAWQVQAAPQAAYQSNVWLRGPQGLTWSDRETHRPRLYEEAPPTTGWLPGQWAWDSREIQVLPGTPPGQYDIVLTLFRLDDLQPLTLSRNGAPVGPTAVIGQVEVHRAEDPARFSPQHETRASIEGLQLSGFSQDRATAAPGDPLLLTLFWEAPASAAEDVPSELILALENEAGETVQRWGIPPVRADYGPQQWRAGERLRGQHLLRLPATLESGEYRFRLGDVALETVTVDAPDRSFQPPPVENTVEAVFAEQAALHGYTVSQEAAQLTVTLVWQGLAEMETGYQVFVHLVDDAGQIVAQSDAEPAQWARPTTGWAPGEYVVDEHRLSLPDGASLDGLHLRVGLFDPRSGERLAVDGEAFLVIEN